MQTNVKELEKVCEQTLAAICYELVALEFLRDQSGWVLRVYIDRPEGGNVGVDDCARASRDLSVALDVSDLIEQQYSLEVSSPGLARPLRRERDFERFAGRIARLRTHEMIEGRRNFKGTLKGVAEGQIAIECEGRLFKVPLAEVVKANLEIEL